MVHGDTSTTFAGALAAFYNQTKIGHVEAGLRTYDKYSPFPEEMNRKLTGAMTDFHFSPTISNKSNLLRENVDETTIYITGNTVIDALKTTVKEDYVFADKTLNSLDFEGKKIILMTAHRRENLGKPLEDITFKYSGKMIKTKDLNEIMAYYGIEDENEVIVYDPNGERFTIFTPDYYILNDSGKRCYIGASCYGDKIQISFAIMED